MYGGESLPSNWTYVPNDCNGGTACDCVDDFGTTDDQYISASAFNKDHGYAIDNPTTIGGGDTIDSVVIQFRGKTTDLSFPGIADVRVELIVGSDTLFGATTTLSTSFTDYPEKFATRPAGGAWTLTDVNALKLNMTILVSVTPKVDRVSRVFAVVWYTPAGGTFSWRRRRIFSEL